MTHSGFAVVKGRPFCLYTSKSFFELAKKKDVVTKSVVTIGYTSQRKMKLVAVDLYDEVTKKYEPLGNFYADVVTGSLYVPTTGECLSSDQISLVKE